MGSWERRLGAVSMLFFDAMKLESMESCSLRYCGKPTSQPFCQMFLIFFPSTVFCTLLCSVHFSWLCVGEISKHHLQFALSLQSRRKQKTRQEASVICGCHFTNNEKSARPCLSRGIKELRRMTSAELKSGIISDYRLGMKTKMQFWVTFFFKKKQTTILSVSDFVSSKVTVNFFVNIWFYHTLWSKLANMTCPI